MLSKYYFLIVLNAVQQFFIFDTFYSLNDKIYTTKKHKHANILYISNSFHLIRKKYNQVSKTSVIKF